MAGWYSFVQRTAVDQRRERQAIEQQLAILEPQAARASELRREFSVGAARRAALDAFSTEGPRLARVLEAVSHATSPALVLTSIAAQADGAQWRLTVSGTAVTDDAASGQAAINAFLKTVAESPFVGLPMEPPSLRMIPGSVGTSGRERAVKIPDWMSGVEFSVQFRVAR
jgi:hypothetical protein